MPLVFEKFIYIQSLKRKIGAANTGSNDPATAAYLKRFKLNCSAEKAKFACPKHLHGKNVSRFFVVISVDSKILISIDRNPPT
jgi:hypothetical protein